MASTDKRILYSEYMIGANFSSPDTLNRLALSPALDAHVQLAVHQIGVAEDQSQRPRAA